MAVRMPVVVFLTHKPLGLMLRLTRDPSLETDSPYARYMAP